MKKIFIVIVSTEDSEKYKFAYETRPIESLIRKDFFEWTQGIYEEDDWGICISHEIIELDLRS